jgi:DNA-binding response OmpR family regulator
MQALLFAHHAEEMAVLSMILQQVGFRVRTERDLENAIDAWPEQPTELIMITLSKDSLAERKHVAQMRAFTAVPIVLITDLPSEDLLVDLLEAGADLIIPRPYGIRGLIAQLRALLRRSAGMPFFSLPTLTQADVILDPSKRTVTVENGAPNHLTQLEFRLLYTLMTHVGQVIPAENIVEHVWGYSGEGNRDLVRGLVQRLRTKVEPNSRNPRYIMTEPGLGYYFNLTQDS